jgi:hypothetical protein
LPASTTLRRQKAKPLHAGIVLGTITGLLFVLSFLTKLLR